MDTIELDRAEYDRLKAERDEYKSRAEAAEAERDESVKASEKAEADKVKAEEKATELQGKVDGYDEKARQGELAAERFEALGKGFVTKLGDATKARLQRQAGSMTDEDWTARLDEIEDLTDVKRDDKGEGNESGASHERKSGEFTDEEIARSHASRSGGNGGGIEQSPAARRAVITKLI